MGFRPTNCRVDKLYNTKLPVTGAKAREEGRAVHDGAGKRLKLESCDSKSRLA